MLCTATEQERQVQHLCRMVALRGDGPHLSFLSSLSDSKGLAKERENGPGDTTARGKKKKSGYEYQKRRNSKVLLNGTRHLFTFCISPKRSNETPWQFFPFCLSEVVLNLVKNKSLPCEFQIQGFASKNCISKLLGVIEANIADSDDSYTSSGIWPFYEN